MVLLLSGFIMTVGCVCACETPAGPYLVIQIRCDPVYWRLSEGYMAEMMRIFNLGIPVVAFDLFLNDFRVDRFA